MEKIYTRKRIHLPKIQYTRITNKKSKKPAVTIIAILIIAIITFNITIKGMTPIIDRICKDIAKGKATIISNDMATEVMAKYNYSDLISINKDKNGNITMIQSNIKTINEITSDVAVKIQKKLENSDENKAEIKFR